MTKESSRRWRAPLFFGALLLCAYLAFRVSNLYLLAEDWLAVGYFRQNPPYGVDWASVGQDYVGEAHVTPGCNVYRPLFGTFYAANYLLFGSHPALWHLSLLGIHLVVCLLLALFARQMFHLYGVGSAWQPALVAMLFLICPQTVTGVAWTAGCTNVLCAAGFLATLVFFGWGLRGLLDGPVTLRTLACLSAGAAAAVFTFLSKETSVVLGPALLLHAAFIVLFSGKARAARAWIMAIVSLAPFALLEAGYLILRLTLFGELSGNFGAAITRSLLTWSLGPKQIWGFLSKWYCGHNPYIFWDYSRAISCAGAALWTGIVLGGLICLALGKQRRNRAAMIVHLAGLFFLLILSVLWRFQPSPIGSDQDSYFVSGLLCIVLATLLSGDKAPQSSKEPLSFQGRINALWERIGIGLLVVTLAFWLVLFSGNLTAYQRAGELIRQVDRAVNRVADRPRDFQTFDVPNIPRFYLGLTCGTHSYGYLNFPYRSRPPTCRMSWTAEKQFFVTMSDSKPVKLVERDAFFARAKVLCGTATSGSITIVAGGKADIFRLAKPLKPRASQYIHIRFRQPLRDAHLARVAFLMWDQTGGPHDWLKSELELILKKGAKADSLREVLFEPGRNPLYLRGPEIREFHLRQSDFLGRPAGRLDLPIIEATVLEYPADKEVGE